MKRRTEKRRETLRPSPNEEANILQSEKDKRKKIRLKQIREQEKAFSRKVLEDGRRRKSAELNHLTNHLKSQWKKKHDEKQSDLKKKYHENLAEVGLGHKAASEDQTNYNKSELTDEEKQRLLRASERYKKALEQLTYDRVKKSEPERERSKARQQALEIERLRAAKIAALPPSVDPVQDIFLKKDSRNSEQKSADDYGASRFHLHTLVQVERGLDSHQVDARQAAKDEEERIQVIMEEVQRDKAEQVEKARLRHKHAVAQLQLEEDRKNLMEELDQLERCDRQRRQDAVAKIPVRIFQPPHKRLEDAEDRQRDLEQAFEDMYMMQTGYMGDLAVAIKLPENLDVASEDSLNSGSGIKGAEEHERDTEPFREIPADVIGPNGSTEIPERDSDQEMKPKGAHLPDKAPKAPSEDPLQRLLQKIERQRDQWKSRQSAADDTQSPTAGTTEGPPHSLPSTLPPSSKQEYRVPHTIPFSTSPDSLPEEDSSGQEAADGRHEIREMSEVPQVEGKSDDIKRPPFDNGHTRGVQEGDMDVPDQSQGSLRTLFHPLEAAQRSHATSPSGVVPTVWLSQQEALLEQEKLKLRLQQQTVRQQQLEQELQLYQKQLSGIYGPAAVPKESFRPGLRATETEFLEESSTNRGRYGGALPQAEFEVNGPGKTSDTVHLGTDSHESSRESSPLISEALESSTTGSLTSEETERRLPSEFQRTLAAAQATADKAAELRQREKVVLKELSRVAENVPFSIHTHPERDSPSVSTPSTLSLSVTLSSELSTTSTMSQTSQTRPTRFFARPFPFASPHQSPFADVGNTGTIKAVSSMVPKSSQQLGFSRTPSSTAFTQPSPFFPAISYQAPQVSGDSHSTLHVRRTIHEDSKSPLTSFPFDGSVKGNVTGVSQSSAVQQTDAQYLITSSSHTTAATPLESTPTYASISRPAGVPRSSGILQQSSTDYSPGYVDFYQQKIEEERQLFEDQRNRIHRYSDLPNKPDEAPRPKTYLASQSNVPSVEPYNESTSHVPELHRRVPAYLEKSMEATGLERNKENHSHIANSGMLTRKDRLYNISKRLDAFEKPPTTSVNSTALPSIGFAPKPASTSELRFGSSRAQYMSMPPETIGLGSVGSAGSPLSSLSELTEMITKLTSTSDESGENSIKSTSVRSQPLESIALERNTKTGSDGQLSFSGSLAGLPGRDLARSSLNGPSPVDPLDIPRSYTPTNTVTNLANSQAPMVSVPGPRWTRGSDGQPWYVLSRSSTLSSVGGLVVKDNTPLHGYAEDDVFSVDRGENSHVSGSADSGSSILSLTSSTLHADSEEHGNAPSTVSSATNGST